MIIKSDYGIESVTAPYNVLLRNKHVTDAEHLTYRDTVLFVHGATYGATRTFDYAVDGESWMDRLARDGFDAWCIDLLGYGQSDRPDEMKAPPRDNGPIVDTAHAVAEVDRAVEFICAKRGISRLNLIGYSWGTAICGAYAGDYPGKVNRLVLSGAVWVQRGDGARAAPSSPGAYYTIDVESALSHWSIGMDEDVMAQIVPMARRRKWCEDTIMSDREAASFDPPKMKAPAGALKDFLHCSATGEPWYDPGKIRAPTLVVVGEFDQDTTQAQCREVFSRLSGSPEKRMTVIGNGTHALLLENHRGELHQVVARFLHSDA